MPLLAGFTAVLILSEIYYRRVNSQEVAFTPPENVSMEREEFETLVRNGRKLVVLDEMVLEVGAFMRHHPGGYFSLNHNIGRDISKFFYGGYSLENNDDGVRVKGHRHGNFARMIVNQLAIAYYDPVFDVAITKCKVINEGLRVNSDTTILTLQSIDNTNVDNFKRFYPGLLVLGKNFLVSNVSSTLEIPVKRHYSICWSMCPRIMANLIRCLDSDAAHLFDKSLYSIDDKSYIAFTIKNYNTATGLSKKISKVQKKSNRIS